MMCEYINELEARGEARGRAIGEKDGEKKGERTGVRKGEAKLASLLQKLYALGRDDDAKLAVQDLDIRARLYREFSIPN